MNITNNSLPTKMITNETFLERHNFPKLTLNTIDHLNSLWYKGNWIIKTLPKNRKPGPDGFNVEFYQTYKEQVMLILHNLFNKTEAEKPPSNLFDQASITSIPKSETLPE